MTKTYAAFYIPEDEHIEPTVEQKLFYDIKKILKENDFTQKKIS